MLQNFPMPGPFDQWVMLILRAETGQLNIKAGNMQITDKSQMVQWLRNAADDLATEAGASGLIIPGSVVTP